jgi:hypothetical protein
LEFVRLLARYGELDKFPDIGYVITGFDELIFPGIAVLVCTNTNFALPKLSSIYLHSASLR